GLETATLVIDSDAPVLFGGRIDLTGTGRRTTAHLVDELSSTNVGGVPVGRGLDNRRGFFDLTNDGVQPVTISDAHMEAGPEANEFDVVNFQPITLQPGESTKVQMDFRPGAAGLRHGMVDIVS